MLREALKVDKDLAGSNDKAREDLDPITIVNILGQISRAVRCY